MSIRGDDLEGNAILNKLDVYVCVDVPVNMSKDNFCANYNRSIGVEGASIAVLNITNGRSGCVVLYVGQTLWHHFESDALYTCNCLYD